MQQILSSLDNHVRVINFFRGVVGIDKDIDASEKRLGQILQLLHSLKGPINAVFGKRFIASEYIKKYHRILKKRHVNILSLMTLKTKKDENSFDLGALIRLVLSPSRPKALGIENFFKHNVVGTIPLALQQITSEKD